MKKKKKKKNGEKESGDLYETNCVMFKSPQQENGFP